MINVLFITNILCRHQVGLWDFLSKKNDVHFTYLCTRNSMLDISIRYKCNETRNYVVYSCRLSEKELDFLVDSSDVIFYGSIEDERIHKYIHKKDKAFIVTENFSKDNYSEIYRLRGIRKKIRFIRNIKYILKNVNKNWVFCASSHTGEDFMIAGAKKTSLLKFGYFPHYKLTRDSDITEKNETSVIYIGRNVAWKHPEMVLYLHDLLVKYEKYSFVACGEGLSDFFGQSNSKNIKVLEPMSNDKVTDLLAISSIFLFPSDRSEGWGNVLGEAMAAGCIVFADKSAGSTRYLVKDGFNGFVYSTKKELARKVNTFMRMRKSDIMRIRKNAVNTMATLWGGENAANRLYSFIKCFTDGKTFVPYKSGPLSLDSNR